MSRQLSPVQDSTLLAEALAESVVTIYDLPGAVVCLFFRKGICDTYRIEAGSHEYYLKVYKHGRRSRMDVEAATGIAGDNGDPYRIRALGEMVGRMHRCADRLSMPYRRSHLGIHHLVDDNLNGIVPLLAHRGAALSLISDIAYVCKARISRLLPKSTPDYGICHGDLHGGDVCYDDNNTPTLFEFDSSGCGWRALDIGVVFSLR